MSMHKEKKNSKGIAKYILYFIVLLVILVALFAFFYYSGIHIIQEYLKGKLMCKYGQ